MHRLFSVFAIAVILGTPILGQVRGSMKIITGDQESAAKTVAKGEEALLEAERDHQKALLDEKRQDNKIDIQAYYARLREIEAAYYGGLIASKEKLRAFMLEAHLVGVAGIDRRSHAKTQTGIAREQFAADYEKKMLDRKLNYEVSTEDEEATVLVIRWEKIDRVYLHQLGKNTEFLRRLKRLGFVKVIASDGSSITGIQGLTL